jgi:large subunit ribosomal protein L13
MTTTHVKKTDVEERWLVYDASSFVLGRMAAEIAMRLMGKDRPTYTPSECTGAHVVVVNAEKAVFTGNKDDAKTYRHYSGYAGGLKELDLAEVRGRRPNDIVKLAVRRMLPKNRIGRHMLKNLRVYTGPEHPHAAQKPVRVEKLERS